MSSSASFKGRRSSMWKSASRSGTSTMKRPWGCWRWSHRVNIRSGSSPRIKQRSTVLLLVTLNVERLLWNAVTKFSTSCHMIRLVCLFGRTTAELRRSQLRNFASTYGNYVHYKFSISSSLSFDFIWIILICENAPQTCVGRLSFVPDELNMATWDRQWFDVMSLSWMCSVSIKLGSSEQKKRQNSDIADCYMQ